MTGNRTTIELAVKLLRFNTVKRQLASLEKSMIFKGARRGINATKKVMSGLFGFVGRQGVAAFRTLKSAILRTFAYGTINLVRNAMMQIKQDITEAADVGLDLARASSILASRGGEVNKVYGNLRNLMADTSISAHLTAQEFSNTSFVLSLAGLKAKGFAQALQVVDKLSFITGEDSKNLAFNFLRLARAFDISENQFSPLSDTLITGMTNSLTTMDDLLQAAKHLGPIWRQAYGPGIESAKKFTAAVATLNDIGVKGSTAGRWLATSIFKMLSPSTKASSFLAKANINLYEANKQSQRYASTLSKLQRELFKVSDIQSKLEKQRSNIILLGGNTGPIDEKLLRLQERESNILKEINHQFELFRGAGGKLKSLDDIIMDINKSLESGRLSNLGMFELFKRLFSIRASKGISAVRSELDSMREKMDLLRNSTGKTDQLIGNIEKNWAATFKIFTASLSKVKNVLVEIFAVPAVSSLSTNFQKNVLDPLQEMFNSKGAENIKKDLSKFYEDLFAPFSVEVGKLFKVVLMPKAFNIKKVDEYWDVVLNQLGKVFESSGISKILGKVGYSLGVSLGEGIWDGILSIIKAASPLYQLIKPWLGSTIEEAQGKAAVYQKSRGIMYRSRKAEVYQKSRGIVTPLNISFTPTPEFQSSLKNTVKTEVKDEFTKQEEKFKAGLAEAIRNAKLDLQGDKVVAVVKTSTGTIRGTLIEIGSALTGYTKSIAGELEYLRQRIHNLENNIRINQRTGAGG